MLYLMSTSDSTHFPPESDDITNLGNLDLTQPMIYDLDCFIYDLKCFRFSCKSHSEKSHLYNDSK